MTNASAQERAVATLGFWIEERAGMPILEYKTGGWHPANPNEVAMWNALLAALTPAEPIHTIGFMESGEVSLTDEEIGRLRTFISLAGDELEGDDEAMATFAKMRAALGIEEPSHDQR